MFEPGLVVLELGGLSFFDVRRLLKLNHTRIIFLVLLHVVDIDVGVLLRHVHIQDVCVVLHVCLVE